jgi:hypothetical protein
VLVATGGCQVVLATGIEARRDGSGVVRAAVGLDDEALRELGDPVTELRLDDLRQAGWAVAAPAKEEDGLTWVRLSKRFSDVDQAAHVAAELSEPDGPFRDFRLEREHSLLRTTTRFSGLVDLTGGLAGMSDQGLRDALGDAAPALDADALRDRGDVSIRVEARLPGEDPQVWEPVLGEELRLAAESDALNVRFLGGMSAAAVLVLVALVLLKRGR